MCIFHDFEKGNEMYLIHVTKMLLRQQLLTHSTSGLCTNELVYPVHPLLHYYSITDSFRLKCRLVRLPGPAQAPAKSLREIPAHSADIS